jgi:hypothetical protein
VSYLKLYRAYTDSTNKQKFCEKSYLDERAMAEIVNVVIQLEMIVSDMNIPILSGGPVEDYLCCIARGHIQFVCVREGRELYRSLTADRILIHPGSVMFRMDPPYIVAGEIVRTTRMYAMSVSPLSHETLEKLSPGLFATFGARPSGGRGRQDRDQGKPGRGARSQDAHGGKLKRPQDFTNSVKIGDEVFALETIRGKKEVRLPWERLSTVKDHLTAETASLYKNLRGTITIAGTYTLLAGEKLSLILTLAPSLNLDNALERKLPGRGAFNSGANLDELLEWLPLLVTPAPVKPAGGNNRAGGKELGFITLYSSGDGSYRLKSTRGFHTSLNESLSSLETLIDELGATVDPGKKHVVNTTYRRLSDMLG